MEDVRLNESRGAGGGTVSVLSSVMCFLPS